jgi:hypothetical protein
MSLESQRAKSLQKLCNAFQDIFDRYDRVFEDTDVVDLLDLKVVKDNGVLRRMKPRVLGGNSCKPINIIETDSTGHLLQNIRVIRQKLLRENDTFEIESDPQDTRVVHQDWIGIECSNDWLFITQGPYIQGSLEDYYMTYIYKPKIKTNTPDLYDEWHIAEISDQEATSALMNGTIDFKY